MGLKAGRNGLQGIPQVIPSESPTNRPERCVPLAISRPRSFTPDRPLSGIPAFHR
jgi:hypothetical protein